MYFSVGHFGRILSVGYMKTSSVIISTWYFRMYCMFLGLLFETKYNIYHSLYGYMQ